MRVSPYSQKQYTIFFFNLMALDLCQHRSRRMEKYQKGKEE